LRRNPMLVRHEGIEQLRRNLGYVAAEFYRCGDRSPGTLAILHNVPELIASFPGVLERDIKSAAPHDGPGENPGSPYMTSGVESHEQCRTEGQER
jgi:hypothetical protein